MLGLAADLAHRFGQHLYHCATGGLIVGLLTALLGYVMVNREAVMLRFHGRVCRAGARLS